MSQFLWVAHTNSTHHLPIFYIHALLSIPGGHGQLSDIQYYIPTDIYTVHHILWPSLAVLAKFGLSTCFHFIRPHSCLYKYQMYLLEHSHNEQASLSFEDSASIDSRLI